MTRDKAIAYGKEQLEIFGGTHREFILMAIEALERKRGKWIPIKDDEHWYVLRWECSCCGFRTTSDKMANYCEDCGADMRGEEDE